MHRNAQNSTLMQVVPAHDVVMRNTTHQIVSAESTRRSRQDLHVRCLECSFLDLVYHFGRLAGISEGL